MDTITPLDTALKTFKASGVEFQEDVVTAELAADIAAQSSDFLPKAFVQRLHGGNDTGFALILLFPRHCRVMQIQLQNSTSGAAGKKIASDHLFLAGSPFLRLKKLYSKILLFSLLKNQLMPFLLQSFSVSV